MCACFTERTYIDYAQVYWIRYYIHDSQVEDEILFFIPAQRLLHILLLTVVQDTIMEIPY